MDPVGKDHLLSVDNSDTGSTTPHDTPPLSRGGELPAATVSAATSRPRSRNTVQGDSSYGVRPREKCTLEDQLGLVLSPKSKIEDGSDLGACNTQVTSVADFWFPYSVELQLILRFALFRRRPILSAEVIGSACCRPLSRLPTSSPVQSQLVRPRPLLTGQPLSTLRTSTRASASTRPC